MAGAARRAGWTADEVPMSDGGEGLLEARGRRRRSTTGVRVRSGAPRRAEWRLLAGRDRARADRGDRDGPGRRAGPAPPPRGRRPGPAPTPPAWASSCSGRPRRRRHRASSSAAAARPPPTAAGARSQAVGSARGPGRHRAGGGLRRDHAASAMPPPSSGRRRAPRPTQVALLTDRLGSLADRYRRDFGVDVDAIPGAGAAGGLAGGLAALGPASCPGSTWWPAWSAWPTASPAADLVVTGEGHLDPPSFHGKVPGGVLALVAGRCPVLCVVGRRRRRRCSAHPPAGLEIVSLADALRHGPGLAARRPP